LRRTGDRFQCALATGQQAIERAQRTNGHGRSCFKD
jgi:hypothetical protein